MHMLSEETMQKPISAKSSININLIGVITFTIIL